MRILHFCNKMYVDRVGIILRVYFAIYDILSMDVVVERFLLRLQY
jgi:hypothetical protein